MKRLLTALILLASLTGCATQDYQMYAEAQKSMANARAMSEAARYNALAEIAKSGDTAAKVAAVMTLQQGTNGGQPHQNNQINAPENWADKALRWAQVIVPTATQTLTAVYTVKKQTDLATIQSNNATATAVSTNNTYASMNTNMANSNTNIANAGFNAVTTVANSGLAATTTVANNGLTAVTNVAGAGLTAVTGVAGIGFTAVTGVATSGLATAVAINANSNAAITAVSAASNASIQAISSQLSKIQPNITTNTTNTTTNTCGANTSGGTLSCP